MQFSLDCSKFLSLVLRHKPEIIGISLDKNGWADVKELIEKSNSKKNIGLTLSILEYVVENNNKKRFIFNEDKTKIRANQGHSIEVELNLKEVMPPVILYHGTSDRFKDSILRTGLDKRNRNHVHLSADMETAQKVGTRHGGKLIIFKVDCKQMIADGYKFYLSENKVWLTDQVPVKYLSL